MFSFKHVTFMHLGRRRTTLRLRTSKYLVGEVFTAKIRENLLAERIWNEPKRKQVESRVQAATASREAMDRLVASGDGNRGQIWAKFSDSEDPEDNGNSRKSRCDKAVVGAH